MLSEKPWRVEAVMRLLLSVIIFVLLGSLLTAVIDFLAGPHHAHALLFTSLIGASMFCSVLAFLFLHRRWELDSLTRRLGGFLFCLYTGFALGMFALRYAPAAAGNYETWRVTIIALSLQGSAVFMTVPFTHQHGLRWPEAFGFGNRWPRATFWGIVVALVCLPVALTLQEVGIAVTNWLGHEVQQQGAVQAVGAAQTWPSRIMLGIVTVLLAPVAEEMIFRGILYPTIKRFGFPRLALWGTSLLFAAIHASLPIFIPLLLLAVALTLLYEKTDNLLGPIVAHGLFNAANFAMLLLKPA